MIETLTPSVPFRVQSFDREKPNYFEGNQLSKEIKHINRNWREEGLPPNWRDLPGTGFAVNKQVDLILSETNPFDSNKERKVKVEAGLRQTDQDIKGFVLEYLAEGLAFPIHYKINSDREMIDANYGNKKVKDITSADERNGSVKNTFVNKVEPFFANAKDGSIAVMTSPSGWSGLRQENGEEIEFPDSQTYIWQKKGDDVLGFTIRTDFDRREHRKMLERLWNGGKKLSDESNVVDFVSNPALIETNDSSGSKNIEDVVDVMRDVRSEDSGSDKAYKNRFWSEVYRDLNRREELWQYDDRTQKLVQEFKDHLLEGDLSREDVKEALSVTILRIAKFLRKDKKENRIAAADLVGLPIGRAVTVSDFEIDYRGGSRIQQPLSLERSFGYGETLVEVQKLPGCNGGGSGQNSNTSLVNSLTPRFGQSSLSLDQERFVCPKCGFEAHGPVGNECPGCGLTKEDYAEESGGPVCD